MQKADKFQITDGGVLVRQVGFSWELSTSVSSRLMLPELAALLPSSVAPIVLTHLRGRGGDRVALGTTPSFAFSFQLFNVFKDIFA